MTVTTKKKVAPQKMRPINHPLKRASEIVPQTAEHRNADHLPSANTEQASLSPDDPDFRWKMMSKKEALRPELRKYLDRGTYLGPTLRHPLLTYHGVDETRAAWINWCIDYKQKEMEKCRKDGNWFAVLAGYSTPFLTEGFVNEQEHFDDEVYWKALSEVWTMQESHWRNRTVILHLFQSSRPKRHELMRRPEHLAFAELPDTLTLYRGYIGRKGKGLSWTTQKETAVMFATRFASIEHLGKPRIVSGVAKKSDVLAFFTRREEADVVIAPDNVIRKKRSLL